MVGGSVFKQVPAWAFRLRGAASLWISLFAASEAARGDLAVTRDGFGDTVPVGYRHASPDSVSASAELTLSVDDAHLLANMIEATVDLVRVEESAAKQLDSCETEACKWDILDWRHTRQDQLYKAFREDSMELHHREWEAALKPDNLARAGESWPFEAISGLLEDNRVSVDVVSSCQGDRNLRFGCIALRAFSSSDPDSPAIDFTVYMTFREAARIVSELR